jgi:hypothetical protein
MRRFGFKAALVLAGLVLLVSASVRADFTSVSPTSGDGPGKDLTSIMTTLYGAGTFTRVDDNLDTIWGFAAPKASFDAQVRYAGDASSMGFFNPSDVPGAATYTKLADITGSGFSASFANPTSFADLSGGVLTVRGSGSSPPPADAMPGIFAFGFHDGSNGHNNYWSSNMGLNNDPGSNPAGMGTVNPADHMVTFFVTNGTGGFTGYVIAYEDLAHADPQNSDRDFNDAVIQINAGLTPGVPEPSTLAMAGLGALGLIGYGIRRRRSA